LSQHTFTVKPGSHYRLQVSVLPPPRSTQTAAITAMRTITVARQ
jgi:hypothetical protein